MKNQALRAKWLCWRCVGEEYLRDEIRMQGNVRTCSYCGQRAKAYSVGDTADRIDEVFQEHFRRTPDYPTGWQITLLSDRESSYDWERDGEPVTDAIRNAADIPDEAADDIQAILEDEYYSFESAKIGEETEYSSGSYYEERGPNDAYWQNEWRDFEQTLKTEARFFSRAAGYLLNSVFEGIESMTSRDGSSLLMDAGPDTALTHVFRARTFQSHDPLREALARPDLHLGAPPAALARAGRMNARGISVFYGADSIQVAVAEVRPPVGSQVAVARFDIVRPLRLLDLTALGSVAEGGSLFDANLSERLNRAMFLRSLSQRIVRPIMPDDEEFDYLTTQVISDFLANENEPRLDGILFPSAQIAGAGHNIALFHHSARVDSTHFSDVSEIEVRLGANYEEGWEPAYGVTEWVPPDPAPSDKIYSGAPLLPQPRQDPDTRAVSLRVNLGSVQVHIIERVRFDTNDFTVDRHRMSTEIRDHWDRVLGGGGKVALDDPEDIPF